MQLRFRLASDLRPLSTSKALDSLPAEPHLLFLCLGNICRSPMAERYARKQLSDREAHGITVDSTGFIETEGRSSPKPAIEVASRYGVDLSNHRSKRVTSDQVDRSDLIILMDTRNYNHLRAEFGGATNHAFFLKPFMNRSRQNFEISDPYNGNIDEFEITYKEVTAAVDGLVRSVRRADEASLS